MIWDLAKGDSQSLLMQSLIVDCIFISDGFIVSYLLYRTIPQDFDWTHGLGILLDPTLSGWTMVAAEWIEGQYYQDVVHVNIRSGRYVRRVVE